MAASTVACQGELGKVRLHAFVEDGRQPFDEPVCNLGCLVYVAGAALGIEAGGELCGNITWVR